METSTGIVLWIGAYLLLGAIMLDGMNKSPSKWKAYLKKRYSDREDLTEHIDHMSSRHMTVIIWMAWSVMLTYWPYVLLRQIYLARKRM